MTTSLERGWGFRGRAAMALLLHLFIVGFVPIGEAFHDHVHVPTLELQVHGSDPHGDEADHECLLCLGATSAGLVSTVHPPAECAPAEHVVTHVAADTPHRADLLSSVSARGPPLR